MLVVVQHLDADAGGTLQRIDECIDRAVALTAQRELLAGRAQLQRQPHPAIGLLIDVLVADGHVTVVVRLAPISLIR